MDFTESLIQTLTAVGVMVSYHTIRFYHWLMIQWQYYQANFARSEIYMTRNYVVYGSDGIHTTGWMPKANEDDIIVEEINMHKGSVHNIIKRCSVIHPNNPTDPFAPTKVPWWFIGCVVGNDEICLTDEMAPFIVAGNVITTKLLERITDLKKESISKWYYIHPATFEETEIPVEGITIYADNTPQRTEELPHTE